MQCHLACAGPPGSEQRELAQSEEGTWLCASCAPPPVAAAAAEEEPVTKEQTDSTTTTNTTSSTQKEGGVKPDSQDVAMVDNTPVEDTS